MTSHFQSSGRGGAGNIVDSSKSPQLKPEDLQTPTLKTSMVTTGRGGTGNFAAGLDASEKRRRQDVEPYVTHLLSDSEPVAFRKKQSEKGKG